MSQRGLILFAACVLVACATGPHPALQLASKDLGCEQRALKLHQIYPQKVRVEGCGMEATYVDACTGYGVEENCGWARQYGSAFERDNAKAAQAERAQAKRSADADEAAEQRKVGQEKQERAAIEREKAEQEKQERAAAERDEKEQKQEEGAAARAQDDEAPGEEETSVRTEGKKPDTEPAKPAKSKAKKSGPADIPFK
jgi:flagellar biosynthesis GTPase FlhF